MAGGRQGLRALILEEKNPAFFFERIGQGSSISPIGKGEVKGKVKNENERGQRIRARDNKTTEKGEVGEKVRKRKRNLEYFLGTAKRKLSRLFVPFFAA